MIIDYVEVTSGHALNFHSTDTRTLNTVAATSVTQVNLRQHLMRPPRLALSTNSTLTPVGGQFQLTADSQENYDFGDPVDLLSNLAEPFSDGSSFQTSYTAITQSTSSGYYHGDHTIPAISTSTMYYILKYPVIPDPLAKLNTSRLGIL